MRTLKFNIDCGAMTCASEPGKFCEFTGAKSFGTKPWCLLFDTALDDSGEPNGWLKRCKECVDTEEKSQLPSQS